MRIPETGSVCIFRHFLKRAAEVKFHAEKIIAQQAPDKKNRNMTLCIMLRSLLDDRL
ncbi:MAG: hypothetical protein MI745_05835 [Pseudomonadales bacterium]|nr:hypothetical protein [Pseudomonadales bacterium]